MAESGDDVAAEGVAFDAEDQADVGSVVLRGDPGGDRLEADGVEVCVDAAVVEDDEISNQVCAEHGVLEGEEVVDEGGAVGVVFADVGEAAGGGYEGVDVGGVLVHPGLDGHLGVGGEGWEVGACGLPDPVGEVGGGGILGGGGVLVGGSEGGLAEDGEAVAGGGEEGEPAVEGYGDAVEEQEVGQVATVQGLRINHVGDDKEREMTVYMYRES